ncbi:MAG: DUF4132 domain-containing protein [Phycisphaerae bacterium]
MSGARIGLPDERAARLLEALNRLPRPGLAYPRNFASVAECKAVLEADAPTQVAFVREVIDQIAKVREGLPPESDRALYLWNVEGFPHWAFAVIEHLFKQKLPFGDQDYVWLVNRFADLGILALFAYPFLTQLISDLEAHVQQNGVSPELSLALARMANCFVGNAAEQKIAERLAILCLGRRRLPLIGGEAWANRAIADLETEQQESAAWPKLLSHCESAQGAQPSAEWISTATPLLQRIGRKTFRERVLAWFPLVDQPRTEHSGADWRWRHQWEWYICEQNSNILKGLVWCCGLEEDPEIARALTTLALSSYKKLPGIGPRLVKVGNACVWALGHMPGMEGIAQLAILRARVKFGTAQQCIEKALVAAAQRVGLPREELEEMAVPAYGLTEVGMRRETLGEFTAELAVTGSSTELRWLRADGKRQAPVPAVVRRDFADELKELRQAAKDLQKMLPAQAERLDQLCLSRKSWPLGVWRERYLDHPLVGTLARRLIWSFTQGGKTGDAVFFEDRFVNADDQPLDWLTPETRVELWHPINHSPDEIFAWRRWLEERHVRQPFKQAHREVYILTDAERQTRVYSNRFAAHILKQHQFNALCAARGWKNKLRLLVDDEFPSATRLLPQWNPRAEFWIDGVGEEYGTDTNETGTFLYLTTDQVRFYPLDAAENSAHAYGGGYSSRRSEQEADPVPLEEVPPLVLSEVLRDVDLFVGVASVGNDASWVDGGPRGAYSDYWHGYAFGELTATAQTRREVLQRLIPKLKIAARCSLVDRFLIVRGDLRTYRIHLGSGNILMEPNDQYLCIVRAPAREGEKVFLPFEGDGMLAIILSKAFMLANDTKITDPTIVSQIRR